ncbi:acyl-CoA dehydrogenase family protein [Sneathiella sp. HT1-7]|jgi:acyl-CoA dehydrogenase|uniref:acyl-CoA dehydrogenase family protein n=1 Tax=Sneathiella sp. HT1-7 TaxID=2887192 RepID=UPI001D1407C6|nr:acyl-CoA dehydrogenase family protein [Sneathiella sp. HT1-7]MCC3303245.1 acyl-CoA/acyl-ACP dehydrogenase [Sneathiella sp. HT1-7]
MDFTLTEEQHAIVENVEALCARFDDSYWLEKDRTGDFPFDFHTAMAEAGWLGITMPEEFGGAGLGVVEAALMMHTVAKSSGGMSAASAIHINIFGPHPIVVFGSEDQKNRWLPPLIKGEVKTCFGVTEPNAGLNTTALETRAEKTADGYLVNGRKIWTTTGQEADKMLLLARTTPKENCKKATDGLSIFYTDMNRDYMDVRVIDKMGRKAVDSNEVFIDNLPVPKEDLIGEEGKGFYYLLHSLNPERVLVGMEAIGLGMNALGRAAQYAREREVFGRPIGKNQAIQHPLAENWMELEAAYLMAMKAASNYDAGLEAGVFANAAKYLGAEAGFKACTQAVMTHGGMGYAKEFTVERLMREVMICRIAPVSPQLVLCYVAEKALGLPKSY